MSESPVSPWRKWSASSILDGSLPPVPNQNLDINANRVLNFSFSCPENYGESDRMEQMMVSYYFCFIVGLTIYRCDVC